jgi:hypothetical protein
MNYQPLPREVLTEALDAFSEWSWDNIQQCMRVVVHNGREYGVGFQHACQQASETIARNDVHALKFETLVQGLQKAGYSGLYEMIMHEPIKDSLK